MTTMTTTPDAPAYAPTAPAARVTFGHLVRAEWIKFWSVRSTIWTLSLMAVAMIALVSLISMVLRSQGEGGNETGLMPFLIAVNFASLALVVLGILTITGEYSTGMIRASVAAEPRRTPVLWSKLAVLGGITLVISALTVAVAALIQTAILGSSLALDLGSPEVLRPLAGNALYLTGIALFAFAWGALLRHSAAAMATVFGLLLVVETAVNAIPWHPLTYIRPFLPSSAGSRITMTDETIASVNSMSEGIQLNAWQGYGVLVAWIVVLLALAAVLLKRRDA